MRGSLKLLKRAPLQQKILVGCVPNEFHIKQMSMLPKNRADADVSAETFGQFPPAELTLENGVIDLWLARIDAGSATAEEIISGDERARAARFRFEADRTRFVAARAFLRIILGRYLRANPREICFQFNQFGKPSLGGRHQSELKFNLSHSDDLALFAVTETREIGVDIERVKPDSVDEGLVSQCLTRREIGHFLTLSNPERNSFFFDCWTRKEALLKASGNGLSLPPNQIDTLSLTDFSTDFLMNNSQSRHTFQSIQTIQKLPAITGYAASLAIESGQTAVRCWQIADAESAR